MRERTAGDVQALRNCVLFKGLSDGELESVAALLEERAAAPGTTIVREGERGAEIFIIRDGVVDVVKRAPQGGSEQRLSTLSSGRTFGEMAFVDNDPRSASVRAVEPTTLAALSMEKLRSVASRHPHLEIAMLRNLAEDLARRLRGTSEQSVQALEQELALERSRVAMGKYITYVVGLMVTYAFLLRAAADMARSAANTSFVSIPVILGFAVGLFAMARRTGEPLADYGLTLRGWRAAVADAVLWTFPVLLAMTLAKWALVATVPAFQDEPVFSFGGALAPNTTPEMVRFGALMVIAYAIIVPFQEFAARGALQGPLERFLTGRYATLLAIVIANGLFVASHLHISPTFALASFLPGVLWGWLYSRSHTLIGPIVSHTLIGTTGLYVLDFQRLLVH